MEVTQGKILSRVNLPEDVKKVDRADLPELCSDLRKFIIDTVSVYGGHFGASLGVTELSVALHYVFNTPQDKLIWDVGHQAYGHKILTGRKENFHTQRYYGGLSGFPKIKESKYDAFGVGHSSTSISAALGMAEASKYLGETENQHIAVIGDGAMTAGMAFEAMNHAGVCDSNMIIILNDNCMSIDPNVGALKDYLTDIRTSKTYNKVRDDIWKTLGKFSKFGVNPQDIVSKIDKSLKSSLMDSSNLFESLGLRYFGPVDGHNIDYLVNVLEDLKKIPGPKILHCLTTKGKGYDLAEKDQTKWHAPGKFNKETGEIIKPIKKGPEPPKFQDVFGHTIVELAEKNKKIMGVTPAMPSGCSLNIMMEAMPERAYDVDIAEQHAVTFSAGLASKGLIPFCNVYSTFMQRAYDQVIHDVCIQNLNVVMCLDRGGLVGADGPTHHGAYDLAFMRCVPNLTVSAPMNEEELRNLMYSAQLPDQGPYSIRYPRGKGVLTDWKKPFKKIEKGTGRELQKGQEIAFLTIGAIGNLTTKALSILMTDDIIAGHYDMRFVKPLDLRLLKDIFSKYKHIITVEDGCLQGGFGSSILEAASDLNYTGKIKRLGIPDKLIEHGTQDELYRECGYDVDGMVKAAKSFFITENELA